MPGKRLGRECRVSCRTDELERTRSLLRFFHFRRINLDRFLFFGFFFASTCECDAPFAAKSGFDVLFV